MGQIEERLGAIARLIRTDQDVAALRVHVQQVVEGPAFTASRRSGQFLQYVVDKAMAQQTDALKERTIGVEVFHRPPDYDTGEDAIVRVTATDVRRRLAQHYLADGRGSEFRITLPPGGYAPEVYRDLSSIPVWNPVPSRSEPAGAQPVELITPPPAQPFQEAETLVSLPGFPMARALASGAVIFLLVSFGVFWVKWRSPAKVQPEHQAPWSLLFSSSKPLLVITADPDLNEIQLLTGRYVSLSDYAAGKLGCETLQTELQAVCRVALRGDKSSTVDVSAITKIAGLAGYFKSSLEPLEARSVRLADLLTDRNVLLLGSRVSNPWADLFRDKLDFYVSHDQRTGLQVVYDTRRRPGEAEEYIPTAGPYGSGDNYTLISFLPNLSGNGYALLLTGATHEGMDAAIGFMLDPEQLGRARRDCGITADESPFQILLKFKMMAGSPLKVTSVTCHRLAAQS